MARLKKAMDVIATRGENLKALFDEMGDVLSEIACPSCGQPMSSGHRLHHLLAQMHDEVNQGAAELGYPYLPAPLLTVQEYANAPVEAVRKRANERAAEGVA